MGSREPFDTEFFRSVGRIVEVRNHPAATLVGSRADVVDAVAAALSPRSPRSVLLVGEQGVGKTTLVVEALRRRSSPGSPSRRRPPRCTPARLRGRARGARQRDRRADEAPLDRLALPQLRGGALRWAALEKPARAAGRNAAIEAREIAVVGEIDPMAYELLTQNRPRVTRIFEVIRLAAMTDEDALAVGRAWSHSMELTSTRTRSPRRSTWRRTTFPAQRRRATSSAYSNSCSTASRVGSPNA